MVTDRWGKVRAKANFKAKVKAKVTVNAKVKAKAKIKAKDAKAKTTLTLAVAFPRLLIVPPLYRVRFLSTSSSTVFLTSLSTIFL